MISESAVYHISEDHDHLLYLITEQRMQVKNNIMDTLGGELQN